MVLFTAPEDMVIGQACNITEREAKSKPKYQIPEEISRVKTISALMFLAMMLPRYLVCTMVAVIQPLCLFISMKTLVLM